MREWIDDLSEWMQKREKISPSVELTQEIEQTAQETNSLLQATDQLQTVYSQLIGKIDHVNS